MVSCCDTVSEVKWNILSLSGLKNHFLVARGWHRSAAPAQIAHQRLVERRGGGQKLVINRVFVTLLAQVFDKLIHDLAVSGADGLRVRGDPQVQFLDVFEDDVAVKRQIQFGLVEQMNELLSTAR